MRFHTETWRAQREKRQILVENGQESKEVLKHQESLRSNH